MNSYSDHTVDKKEKRKQVIIALAITILLIAVVFAVTSCKKTRDRWASQGGILTSHAADYIVISQSGGTIMDVWKLRKVFVQSPDGSDGWLFLDMTGNSIYIGGDIKTIRLNKDKTVWENYQEYHMEFENQTYREKFNNQS